MSIVLVGSTSGSITLQEPAVAGTTTINLPATTGTVVVGSSAVSAAGQIPFSTDGSTYTPTAKIVSGTAVASTSGTSIDFTSIPSWVKRITIMLSDVSTNGTANLRFRIGTSSGFETTGYSSACTYAGSGGTSAANSTAGFDGFGDDSASATRSGILVLALLGSNTWAFVGNYNYIVSAYNFLFSGSKTLGGTLDRVRITTTNGTDAFDAGTINILYE